MNGQDKHGTEQIPQKTLDELERCHNEARGRVDVKRFVGQMRAYDHKAGVWIDEKWEDIHGYLTSDLQGRAVLIRNNGDVEVDYFEPVDFAEGWPISKRIKFYLA